MKFSKIYYTRYHVWQNLVSALSANVPDPETMGQLAQTGLSFIVGDGQDIYEEEVVGEKEGSDTENVVDFRGAYL